MIIKKTFGLIVLMMILTIIILPLVRPEQTFAETKNLALGKTVSASGNEVEWLFAENAVDGDPASRWSSAIEDDQWLIVDLGKNENISRVVINWQTPAETYKILVSKDKEHWVNVKEDDGVLTAGGKKDTIEFDKAEARYVKFQGVKRRPVEGILYGYSIFEFEVYEDKDPLTEIIKDIREKISIEKGQKEIVLPKTPEGYKVTLYGSDRLPVIDEKGRINKPLVDAKVNLLLQVEDESDPDNKISDNVLVTVPGQHIQTEDLNQEPRVIPSLREWYGRTEKFALAKTSKIVVNKADKNALGRTAEITKNDIKEITNLNLEVTYGTPKAGDIYLSLDDSLTSLGEEGSIFDVKDYVSIKSSKVNGVFYGTRTALQILQQDEKHKYIPKGIARDYPKYEDRGFMLDVARKFYSIDFLRDYVKQMSFYKMNRFQIHLNDDVGTPFPDGTKAAFRLESEKYPGLTSKNGFYTKKEFRDLQQLGMDYGINVVPEIDTPGHSGAFIKYDPTLGTANNLDITKPKTVNFVKGLFDEYIDGDNPVFIGPDVHIGTDEYSGNDNEAFRKYMDTLINHINSKGKHPRLWGGLTKHDGETPISNNATMDIWYEPYGGAQHAIDLGYNIVNVYTNLLYIVPQLYADYLNSGYLYNNWEPNNWVETVLPFGHPSVKGAMFALWNDISVAKGVSMADSHHRILPAMQVVSEKMWSGTSADKDFNKFEEDASKIGDAPNVNLSYKIPVGNKDGNVVKYLFEEKFRDSSGNDFDGAGKNVKMADGLFGKGVKFNGGESYIKTPLRSLGFGWTISMWVKPDAGNPDDAVLLESPEGQLKLSQGDTGKLGFSKEGYHSVFDYKVPAGEWTHLLLTGDSSGTSLFVNGSKYAESLKDGGKLETFVLPMQRIGSETNSFKGVIDHVSINNKAVDLHGNLALNKNAESSKAESSTYSPDKAADGKGDTRWSSASEDDAWFLVDLDEPIEINKVSIAWETAYAKKYKILVSEDKENWTNVIKDNNGIVTGSGGRDNITFDKVKARYVKFQGIERATIFGYSFYEFEIYSDKNLVGNKTDLKNRLTEINSENLKESKYTKESWQHLEQALQVTEITLNKLDANQAEIDNTLAALRKARDGLEEKHSS